MEQKTKANRLEKRGTIAKLSELEKLAQEMLKSGKMPSPEVFDRHGKSTKATSRVKALLTTERGSVRFHVKDLSMVRANYLVRFST